MKAKIIKHWPIFVLILIFLFSFYIRSMNLQPDQIVHFDPIFQLRFTQYITDWGHLPIWDEISYYVGRANTPKESLFFWHLTSVLFLIFGTGMSLTTFASLISAFYGAIAVIPAYFLIKEFSNKYGGLVGATLIGTAPQILIRTFGGSFDTDQIVIFFMIFSLYAIVLALKHKNVRTTAFSLLVLTAFALTWPMFAYVLVIAGAFIAVKFALSFLIDKKDENGEKIIKKHIKTLKGELITITIIIASLTAIGFLFKKNMIENFLALIGFAIKPASYIVNISIAELQPFNIFNLAGWITALGNFKMGHQIIDSVILLSFMVFMIIALWKPYKKKNINDLAFVLVMIIIAVYTTFRGIRFTEFSSMLFLTVIGIGFGKFVELVKEKDIVIKNLVLGLGIVIIFIGMSIGIQLGEQLGAGASQNWIDTWNWIKTETPELSIIGTWWDPGHMIAGLAERRNFADGAHCNVEDCFYNINDRITDLGKIMATNDEEESVRLINKYKGNSPKAYWIASSDLIGKFQWCQYFGTGCDGRVDPNCELYLQIPKTNILSNGNQLIANQYGTVLVMETFDFPVPIIVQNRIAILPKEIIYYDTNKVTTVEIDDELREILITALKTKEEALGIRIEEENTFDYTVWIQENTDYIVLIPQRLRNNIFTKMFMLEGEGLEHFKQVFRNDEVKIYEVI